MNIIEQKELINNKNYNAVDIAKFICSIMVVMIHVPPFGRGSEMLVSESVEYAFCSCLCRIAVPFFFICSGFLLYKKTSSADFSFSPTKKYALNLFRLYVIWSVIYFPLCYIIDFKDKKTGSAVIQYIRNFIFSGSYEHLWYLTATVFAVIVISLLLKKAVSPEKIAAAAAFLYLIGLLAQSWFGVIAPLKELTPSLWSALKITKNVIVTTRNGLFEGVLFVGIGMLFSKYQFRIPLKKSLLLFCASVCLLLIEAFTLKHYGFVRQCDMYLFSVPVATFGFSFAAQIKLPDKPIYKKLRKLSSLIYFSHPLINKIVGIPLGIIYKPLCDSALRFIITVIASVVFSLIIIKLSELPKLKLLKKLYS